MELQDIHRMEVKLEDALIELKISEPERQELKKSSARFKRFNKAPSENN